MTENVRKILEGLTKQNGGCLVDGEYGTCGFCQSDCVGYFTEEHTDNCIVTLAKKELEAPTPTLENLLETWSVHAPGMWQNGQGPKDWFAVSNDDGIVA